MEVVKYVLENPDFHIDADVVDIEDGDGDVQLISVSLTLSPDTEDNELLLTPCVS